MPRAACQAPIHHRDLVADHAKVNRLLDYLSPEMAKEVQALDRVPEGPRAAEERVRR